MLLAVARFPVSAQSEGADELLLAAAAFVGPLVVVQPLMQLEVVPRAELLLTYVARKHHSRVNSHMSLELGGLRETLAAILAFKRLFARVEPQMRLQGGLCETIAANLANERPFARVNTKMFLEVVHISEPLLADFAFKRPFARVHTHMTFEVEQTSPCLFADVALKVLLSV